MFLQFYTLILFTALDIHLEVERLAEMSNFFFFILNKVLRSLIER